ncbi:MAG: hypothetical protein NVSMB63_08720 [Sediminibacterium sp.]
MVHAQQKNNSFFRKELSFTTDNDAYLFQNKDAYYTNGIYLRLTAAGEQKGSKIIRSFELGQAIYTPLLRRMRSVADIDRPYCGYLYLKYTRTKFLQKEGLLQWSLTGGTIGNASLGEQLQKSYHSLLHYSQFQGWQYQVQDAFTVDLGLNYARTLLADPSWFKMVAAAQATLGTAFTNAKISSWLCLGAFERNHASALWNARVSVWPQDTRRRYELFGYYYPQLILQVYNATAQGSLFEKGTNAILEEPSRWMFQQNLGICYAAQRWTTRIELVWQSREVVRQKLPQEYASVQVNYRFN